MTEQSEVLVRLEDRCRLLSAVLSLTTYPDTRKPHGTHAHARNTRKYLLEHKAHPAVAGLQALLDAKTPLETLYAFVLTLPFPALTLPTGATLPAHMPADWAAHLADFYQKSNLAKLWQDEKDMWDKANKESKRIFNNAKFKTFLEPFVGKIAEQIVFVPNISYPTDQKVNVKVGSELIAIVHPDLAWGESPPWPYDERPDHVYNAIFVQVSQLVLQPMLQAHADKITEIAKENELPLPDTFKAQYPTWADQFVGLFSSAATAMYLQDFVSDKDAKGYLLVERKSRNLSILPGTISVLRRYAQNRSQYADLIDFLPVFPKQLRVAKKIMSM
jgi:hypothetical protein